MNPRVPTLVQPLIDDYTNQMEQQLAEFITAFYIVGGIALGEFNEELSDIDFVAIIGRKTSRSDLEKLNEVHQAIERLRPTWHLSGIYVQPGDLGKMPGEKVLLQFPRQAPGRCSRLPQIHHPHQQR